jgi:hypothetical protein
MKKNCIWGKKCNGENRRGFWKNTQQNHVGLNTIEMKSILGKIQWRKNAFGAKYNGENPRGFGKIQQKKCILGKIRWRKIAFGAQCNGQLRKRKGYGKIHTQTMHSGQNRMENNCIWGKIQWRKG